MKVTLAQLAPKLGRVDDNLQLHRQILSDGWGRDDDLVVFPELSLTGYLLRDYVAEVALPAEDLPGLFDGLGLGRARPLDTIIGFVELSAGRQCYNSAAYLHLPPGRRPQVVHVHRKVHLPTYGMFDERRYFTPGGSVRAFETALLGRAGMLLCEDLWHPVCTWLLSVDGPALEGAQCLFGLSNSPARGVGDTAHETVANLETWRRLNACYAKTCGALMFHVQRVGVEDSYIFSGGSEVVLPNGEPLARAPLFDEHLLTVELDLEGELRWLRSTQPLGLGTDAEVVRRELARILAEAF